VYLCVPYGSHNKQRLFPHTELIGSSSLITLFLTRRFLSSRQWRRYVPPKRLFLQEPHGVTSQKTTFFIVSAAKTSNLTSSNSYQVGSLPEGHSRATFLHTLCNCFRPLALLHCSKVVTEPINPSPTTQHPKTLREAKIKKGEFAIKGVRL
jgi:hypothetical protein